LEFKPEDQCVCGHPYSAHDNVKVGTVGCLELVFDNPNSDYCSCRQFVKEPHTLPQQQFPLEAIFIKVPPGPPTVYNPEPAKMQTFASGATRSSDVGKNDYEGFLNPLVLKTFGDYMTQHRRQLDGQLRASDNWQSGLPQEGYIKSMMRHYMDLWLLQRGYSSTSPDDGHLITKKEACCALMFNVMGFLLEELKKQDDTK
jgi:hypothetical protein